MWLAKDKCLKSRLVGLETTPERPRRSFLILYREREREEIRARARIIRVTRARVTLVPSSREFPEDKPHERYFHVIWEREISLCRVLQLRRKKLEFSWWKYKHTIGYVYKWLSFRIKLFSQTCLRKKVIEDTCGNLNYAEITHEKTGRKIKVFLLFSLQLAVVCVPEKNMSAYMYRQIRYLLKQIIWHNYI